MGLFIQPTFPSDPMDISPMPGNDCRSRKRAGTADFISKVMSPIGVLMVALMEVDLMSSNAFLPPMASRAALTISSALGKSFAVVAGCEAGCVPGGIAGREVGGG